MTRCFHALASLSTRYDNIPRSETCRRGRLPSGGCLMDGVDTPPSTNWSWHCLLGICDPLQLAHGAALQRIGAAP
jgi:hypothetical protein